MRLKYRILFFLVIPVAVSIWLLFPRTTVQRVTRNGVSVLDTVKRVPLRLGLDLQGGMHLALEIDSAKATAPITDKSEAIDRALKVVRERVDQFGVSEPVVQKAGSDRIIVELPGIDDPDRATAIVQKSAFLQFMITDKSGALERALPRLDAAAKNVAVKQPTGNDKTDTTTKPNALNGLFNTDTTKKKATTDTSATKKDSTKKDSSSKSLFGKTDSAKKGDTTTTPTNGAFSKLVQRGDMPGEYYISGENIPVMEAYLADTAVRSAFPPGKTILWSNDTTSYNGHVFRALYVVDAKPIITGEYLTDARPETSPTEGTVVTFRLNNEGGRRFRNETARHIKDFMAIVLDNRVMGRPPVIQSAIGTNGQITMGNRDLQAAQDLALVLRAGALPVPLKVAEVRNIGPSLGADSIRSSIHAGVIAIALVVLIMIGYYRFSGVLAVAGMLLYVVYTLAALAGFEAVLTLPGLAGFVLSIGIAVDANVLIFERIREEIDRDKSIRLAIDEGFKHALPAIIDSNVSAGLTAIVLYQFGTGPVRGFAVTLLAGIVASMLTSIFVVRTFYMIWLNRNGDQRTLSI